jgi:hypothetical protein
MPDLKSIESVYLVFGFVVPGIIITLANPRWPRRAVVETVDVSASTRQI